MKSKIFFGFLFLMVLSSCQEKISVGVDVRDRFYVEIDDAIMPVVVKGNTQSKTLIIMLHGGPGGHASIYEELALFEILEEEFAMVYWDQRCSGSSLGNCDIADLQISDYVSDVDHLINLLSSQYGEDVGFFLMGHSWGGALTANYIVDNTRASNLKGAIVVDGIHDFTTYISVLREMVDRIGSAQIAAGKNVEDWEKHIASLQSLDQGTIEDVAEANRIANQLETLVMDSLTLEGIDAIDFLDYNLFSNYDIFASSVNTISANQGLLDELITMDISPQLSAIEIPLAVYVGKFDFVTPVHYAEELVTLASSEDKFFRIFNGSGHSPMINEKTAFSTEVAEFVRKFR